MGSLTTEKWKQCPEAPLYDISTHGRVRQRASGRILKGTPKKKGTHRYQTVTLARGDGWQRLFTIHTLVARTFIGPRAERTDVNHIDGDSSNNHVRNLEYVSHRENMEHASKTGLMQHGDKHHMALLTVDKVRKLRAMDAAGVPVEELLRLFKVAPKTLYNARKGVTWKHVT